MTITDLHEYLISFPNVWVDFPFGDSTSVYKIGHTETDSDKAFALIAEGSKPLQLSLKCDPILAEKLREDYETVLPGKDLNKKYWNTILCTGQVPDDELKSLIILGYNLTKNEKPNA